MDIKPQHKNDLHEIIGGIFAYLGDKYHFTDNTEIIHEGIFAISNNKTFEELGLKELNFGKRDFNKSDILENMINNLCISKLLERVGSNKYEVSSVLYNQYDKEGNKIFKNINYLVKEASIRFKRFITH